MFAVPMTCPSAGVTPAGIVTMPTFAVGVVFFARTFLSGSVTGSSMPVMVRERVRVPRKLSCIQKAFSPCAAAPSHL